MPHSIDYNDAYMMEYQNKVKVLPIKLKLTGISNNYDLYNWWKFHVKRPLFSNITKITPGPSMPFTIVKMLIFCNKASSVKLQDPKLLIAWSSSPKIVVFKKKNSANSSGLIWKKPIGKVA